MEKTRSRSGDVFFSPEIEDFLCYKRCDLGFDFTFRFRSDVPRTLHVKPNRHPGAYRLFPDGE